jgi:hypothetical protein
MGLSDRAIQDATSLSISQIHYRLKKARTVLVNDHLTRREFRHGTSPFARMLVSRASHFIEGKLTRTLRALPDEITYGKKDRIKEPRA